MMKKGSAKIDIIAVTNNQDMLTGPETLSLLNDIRSLIEATRRRVSTTINTEMVLLYWHIGDRIRKDTLNMERADYGKQIVQTLSGQLSWSHFVQIIALDDPLKRDFYAEMCRIERWSTRTLKTKIQGMLFERTALSKKPEKLIQQELATMHEKDSMTPDLVFHDPYFLDFLGLSDPYSERDLEAAILRELEQFLLELGTDFTFVARQKRITIDNEDYYLDLLFYHRGMQRLVAIELKLGKFRAQDKGQMELYLRWLDKYEKRVGEEVPLGLILCAEKSAEHVELLRLEESGIRVAEYLTELPPRRLLESKLHEAVRMARDRFTVRDAVGGIE